MRFTKMHGIGNDYVYVNAVREKIADPPSLARAISDRHTGVGADGLILILPSTQADVRMRMFNADGSEAEMCGNGIRCVGKYAYDHGLSRKNPMRIQTQSGILTLDLQVADGKVAAATVNMGAPILALTDIPVDETKMAGKAASHAYGLAVAGQELTGIFVSMGNPHVVFFVDDVNAIDLARLGPLVERHPAFPKRINAHWVQVHSQNEVTMRTWERGSGITRACGTGACAVAVAASLSGRTARKLAAHLPGGDLELDWRADNNVYMTGPAVEVFSGEMPDWQS